MSSKKINEQTEIALDIFSVVRHYFPALSVICDNSMEAGLLLSHLNYWCRQKGQGFYRLDKDLMNDLNITIHKLKAARQLLKSKGFIEIKRVGMPCKNHYHLNYDKIISVHKEIKKKEKSQLVDESNDEKKIVKMDDRIPSTWDPAIHLDGCQTANCFEASSASKNPPIVIIKSNYKKSKECVTHTHTIDEDGFKQKAKTQKEIKKEKKENDPNLWSSYDWRKYLSEKYKDAYNVESFEYMKKTQGDGKILGRIKFQLVQKFKRDFKLDGKQLKDYIDWVFGDEERNIEGKFKQMQERNNFKVNFGFLCSDNLITEWWSSKNSKFSKKFTSSDEENIRTANIINSRLIV